MIKKQIKRFLVAGGCAAATDATTYFMLITLFPYSLAKALAFIAGSGVAYGINKYYTFGQHKKSYTEVLRFCILYSTTFCVNVITNKMVLLITSHKVFLSFVIATIITMCCNFIGQKFFVFRVAIVR